MNLVRKLCCARKGPSECGGAIGLDKEERRIPTARFGAPQNGKNQPKEKFAGEETAARRSALAMEPLLDVIVIGGGPMGLAAAYYCQQRGKSVCVVDISKDIAEENPDGSS